MTDTKLADGGVSVPVLLAAFGGSPGESAFLGGLARAMAEAARGLEQYRREREEVAQYFEERGYRRFVLEYETHSPSLEKYGGVADPAHLVTRFPDRTGAVTAAVREKLLAWAGKDRARQLALPIVRARLIKDLHNQLGCRMGGLPAVQVEEVLSWLAKYEIVLEPPGSTPFAQELFSWRLRKGLTRKKAAKRLGVPVKTYVGWECGYSLPSKRNALRVKKETGIDCSFLFGTRRRTERSRKVRKTHCAPGQQVLFDSSKVAGPAVQSCAAPSSGEGA